MIKKYVTSVLVYEHDEDEMAFIYERRPRADLIKRTLPKKSRFKAIHAGKRFEGVVRKHFECLGFFMMRSAGSRGPADLMGIRQGLIVLIQCKRTAMPSLGACRELFRIANEHGAVAIIARLCGMCRILADGSVSDDLPF